MHKITDNYNKMSRVDQTMYRTTQNAAYNPMDYRSGIVPTVVGVVVVLALQLL